MTTDSPTCRWRKMVPFRKEERFAAQALAELGVPIIKTVDGDGIFEGPNAMWVDRETVILGTGFRANESGANPL